MTKKKAVFMIVACSIAALFFTGVLAVGLRNGGFGFAKLKKEADGVVTADGQYRYEYTWDLEESSVTGLDVEWVNGKVEIKPGSGGKIKITESSSRELKNRDKLDLSSSGGVLKVKWRDSLIQFSLFENKYKDLTIEVPQELAGSLEELTCCNTSGSISAAGFTAEELEISTASGDIELSGMKGEEGEISTTSGTVTLDGLALSGGLTASSTSGSVEITGAKAQEVNLSTVSGDVRYAGSAQEVEGDSVSAAIHFDLDNCPDSAEMDSVSGGLTLTVPENPGFDAEYSSVSGSFSSDFPVSGGTAKSDHALYGNGEADFSFSTTSGSMQVRKK